MRETVVGTRLRVSDGAELGRSQGEANRLVGLGEANRSAAGGRARGLGRTW